MPKILFVTSEATPFIKAGILGDVAVALPVALKSLKENVRLILPAYGDVLKQISYPKVVAKLFLPGIAGKINLLETYLPGTSIKTLLVDYGPAFNRRGDPYTDKKGLPWEDNAERFTLFCRAVCEVCMGRTKISWRPDIVHCNDWPTGLVPALLQFEKNPPASLFTIHNLAYQGLFTRQTFNALSLPAELWDKAALEYRGKMSFIKGGLMFADRVNTVSPHYAKEIQTSEFGFGLEDILQQRGDELIGILNGIDYSVWNPELDALIHTNYCAETLHEKYYNKLQLLREFGLPEDTESLLIGYVGRLAQPKGVDLIIEFLKHIAHLPVQFCLLGLGDRSYQNRLRALANKYPEQIAIKLCYSENLAHQIEAGADAFLMPSHIEPCGLNQLYSLSYGTVPIVHYVGGLADSVVDVTDRSIKDNTATGFVFYQSNSSDLLAAVEHALECYRQPKLWYQIMTNGMRQRFNWLDSADKYQNLYQSAMVKRMDEVVV